MCLPKAGEHETKHERVGLSLLRTDDATHIQQFHKYLLKSVNGAQSGVSNKCITQIIDILGQCGKDVLPKYNFVGESLGKKSDLSNYISLSFDKTSNTIILIAIFYFPFQNRK